MDSKFDWNDITIVPEILSIISSRSEIDIFRDGKLPLFTAPMDTVIDANNITEFEKNNINICLPRNVKYDDLKNNDYFYSYGLDEIIELFENGSKLPKRVLIDVANGHMFKLWNISKKIKEKFGDDIELMVGNIANPDTYRKYCEIGVDFLRVGIGGGSACHIGETAIKTIAGDKRLDDIIVGDMVLTHKGRYKKVIDCHILTSGNLYKLNDNIVTGNHKYYVINKKYIDDIDDNNIDEYAEWISVDMLDNNYLLLGM
jgi:hypothetical protein